MKTTFTLFSNIFQHTKRLSRKELRRGQRLAGINQPHHLRNEWQQATTGLVINLSLLQSKTMISEVYDR